MDFGTKYLTYDEYKGLSGSLPEDTFNLLEYKSRTRIDKLTSGRIKTFTTIPNEVKMCIYDLIIKLNSYSIYDTQNKAISSQSSDGFSISYTTPTSEIEKAKEKELQGIIDTDLENVYITINNEKIPVLYRGVDE